MYTAFLPEYILWEGVRPHGAGAIDSRVLTCGRWKLNQGHREEQSVFNC